MSEEDVMKMNEKELEHEIIILKGVKKIPDIIKILEEFPVVAMSHRGEGKWICRYSIHYPLAISIHGNSAKEAVYKAYLSYLLEKRKFG